MSVTDSFIKEYSRYKFQDDGIYCSKDFQSFARKFKNYLKRNLPIGCEILGHKCNHYDLSGFVKFGTSFVYYSWHWDRYSPVDVNGNGFFNGVLVRHAKNEKDYTGERNEYTSLRLLPVTIWKMLYTRDRIPRARLLYALSDSNASDETFHFWHQTEGNAEIPYLMMKTDAAYMRRTLGLLVYNGLLFNGTPPAIDRFELICHTEVNRRNGEYGVCGGDKFPIVGRLPDGYSIYDEMVRLLAPLPENGKDYAFASDGTALAASTEEGVNFLHSLLKAVGCNVRREGNRIIKNHA